MEEENNSSNPCLEQAFTRFLEKLENLKKVSIVFTDYYDRNEVPTRIMMETPLLMDPVNPFNNLLSKIHHQPNRLTKFMTFMDYAAAGCLATIKQCGFKNWGSRFR